MENNQDNRQRFAALIREHSHSMFRAARAILDCDADAEDAVGEAVLLAWQALPKLKNQAAARHWLLKITVNCAYGQRRSQQRVVYMDDLSQAAGSAPLPEPGGRECAAPGAIRSVGCGFAPSGGPAAGCDVLLL